MMGTVRLLRGCVVVALLGAGLTTVAASAPPALAAPRVILLTPNGQGGSLAFGPNTTTRAVTVMGLATEQLTIATASGSFASNCDLQLTLASPDSSTIAGPVCSGQSGSVSVSLPEDGSYTANFETVSGESGRVIVTATSSSGPASITPGAAPRTVSIPPSREIKLGFAASAGEKYSSVTTGTDNWSRSRCRAAYSILDSDGAVVGSGECGFIDATAIPADGVYYVDIVVNSDWIGGPVRPKLLRVIDQAGTIPTGGAPVAVSIKTPGQQARFTFTATVGNRVSVVMTGSTFRACTMSLVRPDGSTAATTGSCQYNVGFPGFIEPVILDQPGTWSIVVDPPTAYVGTAALERYTIVDQAGTADLSGKPVRLNLSQPGQNARYTFSGTTGQQISAYVTRATYPEHCSTPPGQGFSLLLVRPNGTTAAGGNSCNDPAPTKSAFIDSTTLDATGTWTVVVDPASTLTGTATLRINNIVDQSGAADLDGTPIDVNLLAPGQNARFTFAGTSGQSVSESLTSSTFPAPCSFSVLRPDQSAFASGSCSSPADFLDATPLDASGTWTIVIDPQGPATGTATLQVSNVVDQSGTITPGGPAVTITVATPGQNARYTFAATSGDHRSIAITDSTFPGCSSMFVSVLRPDGTQLSIKGTCGSTLTLGPLTLSVTGTWTIFVDPQGAGTGTATMTLT